MSEKMSFYLNLSPSNESSAKQVPETATPSQTQQIQLRVSDIEKAKKVAEEHEMEKEELRRQNNQLIDDVNMLVR